MIIILVTMILLFLILWELIFLFMLVWLLLLNSFYPFWFMLLVRSVIWYGKLPKVSLKNALELLARKWIHYFTLMWIFFWPLHNLWACSCLLFRTPIRWQGNEMNAFINVVLIVFHSMKRKNKRKANFFYFVKNI